ncbi:MAG TPA: SDR family oxidoreductase [Dehalococcoidia bacterium]|nr:SDR family oxidoreductase [Dehalococcoidia bacterium]
MTDPKPLDGKIALITGGTRGIGRACALRLGGMGAELILNYNRNQEDADRTVAELTQLGYRASHLRANMGDLDEIHTLFGEVKEQHGGLDILINSAARGLERPRNAINSLPNHLRQTFEMNVLGPWFATKEAAPLMEARGGGAVVNMTSLGAQRYLRGYAAVGVTKGALDTLTFYLGVELAPKGIRVNGVCPSWVDETAGVQALPDEIGAGLLKATPIGRHCTPDDVAGVVAFLCGPDSGMIVGQTIVMDGGTSLVGPVGY